MNIQEILDKRGLDPHQKAAVHSDSNTVVSAGAGSGKTTVLSYRFLRLVMEGKATVDSILTLTFTRKAAAEMYERIHGMLLQHKADPVIAKNLDRLDRAQISTLDSFCTQIVRSDCRRYGYASSFVQDEEALRQMAEGSALSFIHEQLDDEAMRHLLSIHSFTGVFENLLVPLALYHMAPSRLADYPEVCQQQLDHYRKELRVIEGTLLSNLHLIAELETSGKQLKDAVAFSEQVIELIDRTDDPAELYEAVIRLKLPRKPGKVSEKNLPLLSLKEYIPELKELWPRYLLLLNTIAAEEVIISCYGLLGKFQDQFMSKKRAAGLLSFSDIAQMAVDILIVNQSLRDYYKQKFSHIMIDEFQDNNDQQRQLLYLLSERQDLHSETIPGSEELTDGKLFFVGDEKQSIYRFRGADVSVFKTLADEIGNTGGTSLSLATNYRSEPGLIETFNAIFPAIMREPEEPFEAVFEPLDFRSPREGILPQIHLLIKDKESPDIPEGEGELIDDSLISDDTPIHDDDAEAWYIAQRIHRIVSEKRTMIYDGELGIRRPAGYDDIAILMQTLSNQMRFERALRGLRIPFDAQSVRALFLEAPINDIYSMLQLIVYPTDTHAFAALMRSPFVHLGDDRLYRILSAEGDFRAFDDRYDGLFDTEEPAAERYHMAKALYGNLLGLSAKKSKAELIEYIWYESGYRYFIMNHARNHRYLEYVDYARELAILSDEKGESLAEFLDGIRKKLGTNERVPDLELLKTDSSGVKLMTIHKSKGLEFPIVFVTNMGNKGRSDTESVITKVEDVPGPVVTCVGKTPNGASYFFHRDKDLKKRMHAAEMKRLLYVAATRAEDHLYLSGCFKAPGKSTDTSVPRHLLDLVFDGFSLDKQDPFAGEGELQLPQSSTNVEVELHQVPGYTEKEIRRLRSKSRSVHAPQETLRLYEAAPVITYEEHQRSFGVTEKAEGVGHDLSGGIRLPRIPSDAFLRQEMVPAFGTYCHALIEASVKGLESEVSLPEELSGLPEAQQTVLREDAQVMRDKFLASELFSEVSSAAAVIESEVPFMMKDEDGTLLRGIIDLMVETEDDLLIIDFKTDSVKYPDAHRYQLDHYITAMRHYTGKTVRAKIWYLREE